MITLNNTNDVEVIKGFIQKLVVPFLKECDMATATAIICMIIEEQALIEEINAVDLMERIHGLIKDVNEELGQYKK